MIAIGDIIDTGQDEMEIRAPGQTGTRQRMQESYETGLATRSASNFERPYGSVQAVLKQLASLPRLANYETEQNTIMMDELISAVSQKTGLSTDQSRAAVESVLGLLRQRLPAPFASGLESLIGGSTSTAATSAGGDATVPEGGQEGLVGHAAGMLEKMLGGGASGGQGGGEGPAAEAGAILGGMFGEK